MELLKWVYRAFGAVGCIAGAGLALVYAFQEKLLYVPVMPGVPSDYIWLPNQPEFNFKYEDVALKAKDGTKLHAWMLWPQHRAAVNAKPPPVMLFFQENAGNISHRLPFLKLLSMHLRCAIFVLSYRGYGTSEGAPSEKGIQMDAVAALEHVRARDDVDTSRIVAFGRSLGGAVALHLAAARGDDVHALVIDNTFLSVEDMAGEVLPPLKYFVGKRRPFNFLVRNKWRNVDAIRSIGDKPLLMLASLRDEMVPHEHMKELHRLQPSSRCSYVEFKYAHHMDTWEREPLRYWSAFESFWHTHVCPLPGSPSFNPDYRAPRPTTTLDHTADADDDGLEEDEQELDGMWEDVAPELSQVPGVKGSDRSADRKEL